MSVTLDACIDELREAKKRITKLEAEIQEKTERLDDTIEQRDRLEDKVKARDDVLEDYRRNWDAHDREVIELRDKLKQKDEQIKKMEKIFCDHLSSHDHEQKDAPQKPTAKGDKPSDEPPPTEAEWTPYADALKLKNPTTKGDDKMTCSTCGHFFYGCDIECDEDPSGYCPSWKPKPATKPEKCPTCNGKGWYRSSLNAIKTKCGDCKGTGKKPTSTEAKPSEAILMKWTCAFCGISWLTPWNPSIKEVVCPYDMGGCGRNIKDGLVFHRIEDKMMECSTCPENKDKDCDLITECFKRRGIIEKDKK